jgi:hypothetical protein
MLAEMKKGRNNRLHDDLHANDKVCATVNPDKSGYFRFRATVHGK